MAFVVLTCKNCGKTYTVDLSLGIWQKDNTQKKGTSAGVSPKNFCCYKCGKKYRAKQIGNTWKNKSPQEKEELDKKRKEGRKTAHCVVCGKECTYAGGNVPICSDECREKRRLKIPQSGKKICQNCGKEYYYKEGQGSWNKNEQLVNERGKHHGLLFKSHKFCSYKCGLEHKEAQRKATSLSKYGFISPFQDMVAREVVFEKMKKNGTLFSSKPEKELRAFIENLGFKTEKYIIGNGIQSRRFELDIYIPEKQVAIEFNGAYFHSINGRKKDYLTRNYHYDKAKVANEMGIDLIQVWEDQWTNQKDLVKSIIKARLNIMDKSKAIYARQCIIKEISTKAYKDFCETNHIQGYRSASIKLGLFYQNKLVQIASFSKTRNTGKANKYNSQYEYEWVRGCPSSNNFVIGGTSKLFKYFIKTYDPSSVLCYSDWNLFNGRGYKECGFEFDGFTGPDKFYIQPKPILRIGRSPFRYRELMQKVRDAKIWLCYGAGSQRFVWKKK